MTFQTTLISSIIVNREARQRKEMKQIPELAESIARLGLIHPIVIDKDNVLVAGERRLTACKSLGWSHITTQYREDLDELTAWAIELEENIKRVDITWQEECVAIEQYHALRKQQEGVWTMADTSRELGISPPEVTSKLAVAAEIKDGNERVISADKYSTARNITERKKARVNASTIDASDKALEAALGLPSQVAESAASLRSVPLLNEDFHEWASGYCGPRFNMIHCDFPYGVGMHKSDQGAGQEFGTYADGEDVINGV